MKFILIQLFALFLFLSDQNNYFVVDDIDEELFNEYNIIQIKECRSSNIYILLTSKNNKFIGNNYEKMIEKNLYKFNLEKIDYPLVSKINLENSKKNKRPSIRSQGKFKYIITDENEEILLNWENDTISGTIYADFEIKGLFINKNRRKEKCP